MKRKLLAAIAFVFVVGLCWLYFGPIDPSLLDESKYVSTVVVDRNGVVLHDGFSASGTRSAKISADSIPPFVEAATLAAEDRRFYAHPGVDPISIARAFIANVRALRTVQGGSTITQQTAKMLLARGGARRRGLLAKLEESVLAVRLERRFGKREILARYLNLAPYGNQFSGIERASRGYFGVPASELTTAQAALLASIPQRPSAFDPYRNFAALQRRQRAVLASMRQSGRVPRATIDEATRERITLRRGELAWLAPHFVERVREAVPESGVARVVTTLDADLQRSVRGIIDANRANLRKHGANNVAVVVLKNDTGEWLAWEGSGDYFDAEHGGTIDGVRALRQPGSTVKPFTYALAFERGYDPASVLPDIDTSFATGVSGIVYAPRNYDGRFRGPLLARKALAGSINVPAVWLLSKVGAPALQRYLKASGVSTLERSAEYYGLGLTLGDAEMQLDELTSAYSQFAGDGSRREPSMIRAVEFANGRRVISKEGSIARGVSPQAAFWIRNVLSDGDAREFIFGRGGNLDFDFPVAVKTGTSQSYRDNWTIGFTKDVTVGVWVGNFDRTPLRNSSGVTGAAPIFHGVMLAAQKKYGTQETVDASPDGLRESEVCLLSGQRATMACPARGVELLPANATREACAWHVLAASQEQGFHTETVWPAEYRSWARTLELPAPKQGPRRENRLAAALEIVSPPEGATYLIDPTLRREYQTLRLRASAPRDAQLRWLINGREVRRARASETVRWPLAAGAHVIEVRDDRGHVERRRIEVR